MRRTIWILVILAITVGIIWGVQAQPGVRVETAAARRGAIRTFIEERARTRLSDIYRVSMPLDGRVQPITLEPGDQVQAGQTVATLDEVDLETELAAAEDRVQEIENVLASLDAMVRAAQSQVEASAAKLEFTGSELRRKEDLRKREAITESDIDRARLEMIESRIDKESNSLIVKSIDAMRAAAELVRDEFTETLKQRQRDRNRATLTSPVDGTVLTRHVSSERFLSAGTVLLEIGRSEDIEVEAEVLTQDALEIPDDADVDIELDAEDWQLGPLAGQVQRIYPQGFTKVSSLGVEQQRVLVIIEFAGGALDRLIEHDHRLGVDYRVNVRIYTNARDDVLLIPRSALFRSETGSWQTFLVRKGRAVKTDVDVGLLNDRQAEIRHGLSEDDDVIIAPPGSLNDGDRVEPTARSDPER